MAMTEDARLELYEAFRDKVGHRPATTLMESIPPVGWADVATKHDLAELERRLDLQVDASLAKAMNELLFKLIFAVIGFQVTFGAVLLGVLKLR